MRRRRRKKGEKYPHTKASCQECAAASLPMALTLTLQTLFFFCQITTAPIYPFCFHGKKTRRRESLFIYWMIGSTMPQANRFPAFPVFRLSGLPPRPKSSSVAWTTKARPLMSFTWPFCSVTKVSRILTEVKSSSGLTMFPRSPTCLSASFWGWPWSRCSNKKLQA